MSFTIKCLGCGKNVIKTDYLSNLPDDAAEHGLFAIVYWMKDRFISCNKCIRTPNILFEKLIQPERSKREDSQKCEMRCSEHCGNTMRDK